MGEDVTGVTQRSGLQMPQQAMPGQEGTQPPAQQEIKAPEEKGVPQTSGDDLKNQLASLTQKYEQDISRLRQSLDKRYSQDRQTWQSERETLTKKLNDLVMSSMDEEDREAYELELLREERQSLTQQLNQERQRSEQSQAMLGYAKWFNELGVPYDKLNFESPESLMESAWGGLKETMNASRQKIADLEAQIKQGNVQPQQQQVQSQQQSLQRKPAPNTFTGKGAPPGTEDLLLQVQKGLKEKYGRDVTFEETFRAIESGAVDINSLLRAGG
jgi:hypothetical protein